MGTTRKIAPRDEKRCAPQDVVDERAHRWTHEYRWDLSEGREADGDQEVGELVCFMFDLIQPGLNSAFRTKCDDGMLVLHSDQELDPRIIKVVAHFCKDVAENLEYALSIGLYDEPRAAH